MADVGYKRTWAGPKLMSALTPEADIPLGPVQVLSPPHATGDVTADQQVGTLRYKFLPLAHLALAWYAGLMTYNAISVIESLVEDHGWEAVVDQLLVEAATATCVVACPTSGNISDIGVQ